MFGDGGESPYPGGDAGEGEEEEEEEGGTTVEYMLAFIRYDPDHFSSWSV